MEQYRSGHNGHDWKSCVPQKGTEGSNPSCSAIKTDPIHSDGVCFYGDRRNLNRFYVNSWGRDKTQIIASRVGVESPARFLCTAEEDSVSEITEVTYPEADPLQDFGLVVAALNKAI